MMLLGSESSLELTPHLMAVPQNPLEIAPRPGGMIAIYHDLRRSTDTRFHDGMLLACATPRSSYADIVEAYTNQAGQPGFSPEAFWQEHFDTPEPDVSVPHALPGQSTEDYARMGRELLVKPPRDSRGFNLGTPYHVSVAGGGRFARHAYHWDAVHMARGYAADGRWDLVLNVVGNAENEILTYGHTLNGNAAFYASRPQIPHFSHAVELLAEKFGPEALVRYLPALEEEYKGFWMSDEAALSAAPDDGKPVASRAVVRMPDGSVLNRYWDDADGPRFEMHTDDVELGEVVTSGLSGVAKEIRLARLYKDIRAAAASGWDFSSRWMGDAATLATIKTTDIVPVDLNSMLYHTESTIAQAYRAKSKFYANDSLEASLCEQHAVHYEARARSRADAMNIYLWDAINGVYRDYDTKNQSHTPVLSAASAYPLYVGLANESQTFATARFVHQKLLFPAGVATTVNHGLRHQWDGKERSWAPTNWAVMRGLAGMAHRLIENGLSESDAQPLFNLAARVRGNYLAGIRMVFRHTGLIPEKHRADFPLIPAGGGEYDLVSFLGMTAETFIAMNQTDVMVPPVSKRVPATQTEVHPAA